MRRIAALVCGLTCLVLPASAGATITTTNDPALLAGTLGGGAAVGTASFQELAGPTATPHGTSDNSPAIAGFPTEGTTFAILTSGTAAVAGTAGAAASVDLNAGSGHGFEGAPGDAWDTSVLSIPLTVPGGVNCLNLDFRFFSEDAGSQTFNDGFLAMLDQAGGAVDPSGDISAPTNFAFDETGHLVNATGSLTPASATGTAYEAGTQLLTARTPVTAGQHTLYLAIFDVGDEIVDSAAFVDNLRFTNVAAGSCNPGGERTPPVVTLNPVDGGTLGSNVLLSGTAGQGATDSQFVSTQIYPAGQTTPVQVLTTPRSGGTWNEDTFLAPGNYVARTHQTDSAGNVGVSQTRAFTVGGEDVTPPQVRINLPANGSSTSDTSPTLSGTAGSESTDSPQVEVTLRAGSSTGGNVVQSLVANRIGGSWSVAATALAPGTYTATATQTDSSDNVGASPPVTFAVTATPPPQQEVEAEKSQSPEPVLGQTVVAGAVGTGTVRIKGRDGKFRKLGANEAIPLGSEIDATNGRVRLTSASGPGGATQTADFYQGAFRVTQTRGVKPITQLALSARLSCGKKSKKAQSSAKKKKVRRLWGDGKGSFRTRGRNAAATVRGTKWLTEDRCDSTKITVKRGKVLVRDFLKRKNLLIKKGHSYVAKKKKKKKK